MPNPSETSTPSPTPSFSPDAGPVADRAIAAVVQREQVRLLYEQLPQGVASVLVAAAATSVLFWNDADPEVAGTWLGLIVAASLAHLIPWVRRRQRPDPASDPRRDLVLFTAGAALSGSLFGLAPVVFAPAGGFESLAMMLTIIAMLGVAGVAALGADFRIYLVFLLPLTLPATVRMFYETHPAASSMGLLRLVFIALLVALALQLRARLQQILQLRVQDAAQGRELGARADRLQAEIEQRRSSEKNLNAYVAKLEQTSEALTREVAERQRKEESLARQALTIMESEVRLRAIFNNAFDGIVTFDSGGLVRDANPAAEHLFGANVAELRRRKITDMLPDLKLEDAAGSRVRELTGRKTDGSSFPVSLSLEPTDGGKDKLFVCLVRDNTAEHSSRRALVEARDAAERANRAKSEFLSNMSHELRTPMNSILGFAQVLQTDPESPLSETQKESVDQIARAGWHLLQLINDVLDLAKVEAGKIEAILVDVELDMVMAECLSLVMPLADKHGIEVVDQASGSGLHVRADHTRLKQIVLNLVSNGIKYNRKNGSVAIEAKAVDDWCEITVVDTGVGLTTEQVDCIFEPFSRVAARRDEIEGTGIGLTITRKLVALMGGAIGVESEPGSGSRFWVRIPLFLGLPARAKAQPVLPAVEAARAPPAASQQTVLYVEDNPANLALVEYVLRQRRPHLRLLSAHTGELGIALAESQHPDVIILDISLPGMDGYQVLEVLRNTAATRHTPVFALSANAMRSDIARGLEAGFDDYLTKPIDVARLLSTIDALLERRAAA